MEAFKKLKAYPFGWRHLIILMLVIHLLPVWAFPYFPSQDGPRHVATSWLVCQMFNHSSFLVHDAFKLNRAVFPYWACYLIMGAYMKFVPPLIAEKLFLSLYISLFSLSLFYLMAAVGQKDKLFGLLGFLLAYNLTLIFGFYNFIFSLPMYFFTVGFWLKHRGHINRSRGFVLAILLFLTYISHIMSFVLLSFSLLLIAVSTWALKILQDIRKLPVRSVDAVLARLWQHLARPMLYLFLCFPVGFILFHFYVAYYLKIVSYFHFTYRTRELEGLLHDLAGMKSVVFLTGMHTGVGYGLFALLLVAVILTVISRFRQRQWMLKTDQAGLLALMFLVIFFIPLGDKTDGLYLKERVLQYIPMMLIPWLSLQGFPQWRKLFAGFIILLSLVQLGITGYEFYNLNGELIEFTAGVDEVKPHTNFAITYIANHYVSDALRAIYPTPFAYAAQYYSLRRPDVYSVETEVGNDTPLASNKGSYKPFADYVLGWKFPNIPPEPAYESALNEGNLTLLRLKQLSVLPDMTSWKHSQDWKSSIQIDLSSGPGQLEQGHQIVGNNTVYTPGRFGWVTSAPEQSFANYGAPVSQMPGVYRTYVADRDDGAFRLDLPNGTYKVTLYFYNDGDNQDYLAHDINLIANDKPVFTHLIVPDNWRMEKSYTVKVTQGVLNQVVYTDPGIFGALRYLSKSWFLNGFQVEQLQ